MKEVDTIIWETKNFVVVTINNPFISREEGGHLILKGNNDKYRYNSRVDFTPEEALEYQRLSQMISIAYTNAMRKQGIDIIRLNYFEAGNWAWKKDESGNMTKPFFHEHIFGRTLNAKYQIFPDAPYLPDRKTGFYDNFNPLTEDDVNFIIQEMKIIEKEDKYIESNWSIR